MPVNPDLAINLATTRPQWSLAEAIAGYARAGIRGIGIWPDKLAECGLAEARRRLDDTGMVVTSYCVGEMTVDRAGNWQTTARNRQMIDEAAALNAVCMISVAGGLPAGSRNLEDVRKRTRDTLAALLPYARAAGVRLAVEPVHPMRAPDVSGVSTLAQANDLCIELGDGVGVAIDPYHVWWDPALPGEIERARGRILSFQLCDWLAATPAVMNSRGMMGDGVIDLARMHAMVRRAGFDGLCEVEILSDRDWWLRDPADVVQTCLARIRDLNDATNAIQLSRES